MSKLGDGMGDVVNYGLDLGTTNSAIARQDGIVTKVIELEGGAHLLPSLVHMDAHGALSVGFEAYHKAQTDPLNTAAEFKRLMGTSETISFQAAAQCMDPVALSAEILKRLLAYAAKGEDEPIRAAVVTIPAMFELPQCEATRKASQLAGLQYSPLLQEPIAAAMAQAGKADLGDGYWLVYDLGGGTFDVSLVRSRRGRLQVIDHDGDNHLGGKDLDRAVARRAAEQIRVGGELGDFRRSDSRYAEAHARLKNEAERVRLELSDAEQATFAIDRLAQKEGGDWVGVRFAIDRGELEALIKPIILRTAAICDSLIDRNGLTASRIKSLVLVGGPTLTPCLPKLLRKELGLQAENFGSPMDAVARGAALYGATRRLPSTLRTSRPRSDDALFVELSFEPMTNDRRPILTGRMVHVEDASEWTLKATNRDGSFDSGPVNMRGDGRFVLEVQLSPGAVNVFDLSAHQGSLQRPVDPASFSIIHGLSLAKPPLSRSVGVMLADNSVRWYLRKGVPLPAKATVSHVTVTSLNLGNSGSVLSVPIIQGESERGDRNQVIGVLEIDGNKIEADLPAGSEVRVTIAIDEHSTTKAGAFVPILGQTFDRVVRFGLQAQSADDMMQSLEVQKQRLDELETLADSLDNAVAPDPTLAMIQELVDEGDRDALDKAASMLRQMTITIDEQESGAKTDRLVKDFEQLKADYSAWEAKHGRANQHKGEIEPVNDEFYDAVAHGDVDVAEARLRALRDLFMGFLYSIPEYWQELLKSLAKHHQKIGLTQQSTDLIESGKEASKSQKIAALAPICIELIQLLPAEHRKDDSVVKLASHII